MCVTFNVEGVGELNGGALWGNFEHAAMLARRLVNCAAHSFQSSFGS